MTNMISVATGFQSSVNIAYDMNDDAKLKNYIPTKSALSLLEDVLLSTSQDSTDRARILIGAYGKGKSHIVLMILSILMKKDPELFEKMMPVISSEKPELYQLIQNYYHGSNKILPVVISGSSNSLAQAFLLALERTLAENELTDIMPETNYQAAINTIAKWKSDFPETYNRFKTLIDGQANKFIERLRDFDPSAYAEFEKLYPSLTAGSHFNPFVGFDVAELYEEVVKALKPKGYAGNLHKYYVLTSSILRKIDEDSLEAKIVKTLALIYILEHFEKLKPTLDELTGIYSYYGTDAVNDAVKRLVEEKYVVYLKRSNNYLRLKETSGVDVRTEIINMVGKRAPKLDIKNVLNESNFDHYLYPWLISIGIRTKKHIFHLLKICLENMALKMQM